jgi:hypothetical protein
MDLSDPQQWSAYNYSDDSPVSQSDPTGLDPCIGGGGGCHYDGTDPGGNGYGGPHPRAGSTGGGGNHAAASPSGNVAESVPVEGQKEKCGWFAPVCHGWQRSMEWVHQNQDAIIDITRDGLEIYAGLLLMQQGPTIAAGAGILEIESGGTATFIAATAATLGVTAVAGGGALAVHGAINLGKHLGDLHWNNQADSGSTTGRIEGSSSQGAAKPTYENPGHHDPTGGPNPYNPKKAVVPSDAEEQFANSVQVGDTRWTKIGSGKKAVYYRYFQHGDDVWHWSGSSNGVTKSRTPVPIPLDDIPIQIRRM